MLDFTVLAAAGILSLILIVITIFMWKLAQALIDLTRACRSWVEIYFPPHINQAAQSEPTTPGATRVTINKGWDDEEPPRD